MIYFRPPYPVMLLSESFMLVFNISDKTSPKILHCGNKYLVTIDATKTN